MGNPALKLTERILDFFTKATEMITRVMVVAMVVIMVTGVIARYAFNRPLGFVDEYVMYLMVGLSVLAANYVLKEKGHIKVDIVTRLLPPRAQAWLLVVTDILSMFAVAIILIQVISMTALSFETGTISITASRTPMGPIQLMLPIGFGLLLVEFLRITVVSIKSAVSFPKSES